MHSNVKKIKNKYKVRNMKNNSGICMYTLFILLHYKKYHYDTKINQFHS